MASRHLDEEAIFHFARKLGDPADRAEYLDQICGGDMGLRSRVTELLKVDEEEQDFLKSSHDPGLTVEITPIIEREGTTIGRYVLREQIGEGGMGAVFVAEQERPVRRKVAIKIIKPGMDTKEVIARFEAERQALAMMDHPNIARILDAGTTESGRPYFVMEMVRGIPITDYCDKNKLTVPERLTLFMQVCQAIQHAHQKGIIHRDIKPNNVLVTLHDGKPVPKVIDFGIAKATNQRLTDRTVYTRLDEFVGTPMYMSPEQAELSGLDVDTRTDIYSLGMLLYELLTGTPPFDRKRLADAALDEMRRIVREEEPPRPSMKVSTLGNTATAVCEQRKTDVRGLARFLIGDIDVIVMKALEKDRTHRYDAASNLAADVERFLNDEPIIARSPSLAYRLVKFIRRNRLAVAAGILITLSLVSGILTTTLMAKVAWDRLEQLATSSYEEAVTAALAGNMSKAEEALRVASKAGLSEDKTDLIHGLIALNDGRNDEAVQFANSALEGSSSRLAPLALRAVAHIWSGYDDRGELDLRELAPLEPISDADRLLKAYAMLSSAPDQSMQLLKKNPALERSSVGLVIRAFHSLLADANLRDRKSLEKAARDFEYVQFLFQDNRASCGFRLLPLSSAIRLAQSEGQDDDVQRYIKEGLPAATKLAAFTDYPAGDWTLHQFYQAAGEEELAWKAIRRVGQHPGTYTWFLAAACLERYGENALVEFEKAIDPKNSDSKYVRVARAYLASNGLPNGQDMESLVGDMLEDPSPFLRRHALLALCLDSGPEEIRQRAKTVDFAGLWYDSTCLKYLTGEIDEGELLSQAHGSPIDTGSAHFTLAMMCLAEGDRPKALQHFKACRETDSVGWFDYEWSKGFVVLLEGESHSELNHHGDRERQ